MYDQKSILIADDEEHNYLLLKHVIGKIGRPHIYCADTGDEAVLICYAHPELDLVLMDIQMPYGDGYEAHKKIKSILPHVPIVAITAFAMLDYEQKVLDAGFDMYVRKPISAKTVELILDKYLIPKTL